MTHSGTHGEAGSEVGKPEGEGGWGGDCLQEGREVDGRGMGWDGDFLQEGREVGGRGMGWGGDCLQEGRGVEGRDAGFDVCL